MKRILVCLALALALGVMAPTPAAASVGNTFHVAKYTNPASVFIYANAGTAHIGFRAWIECSDGSAYSGPFQTQPGPWYGSGATCLNSGTTLKQYGWRYW